MGVFSFITNPIEKLGRAIGIGKVRPINTKELEKVNREAGESLRIIQDEAAKQYAGYIEETKSLYEPYGDAGKSAISAIETGLGVGAFGGSDTFEPPTAENIDIDPGYQFRLREGQKSLERSNAASGLLNSGANLKGITDYSQNSASQEYASAYDRSLKTYQTRQKSKQDRFNRLLGVSNQGLQSTNSLSQYSLSGLERKTGHEVEGESVYQQGQIGAINADILRQQSHNSAKQQNLANIFGVVDAVGNAVTLGLSGGGKK